MTIKRGLVSCEWWVNCCLWSWCDACCSFFVVSIIAELDYHRLLLSFWIDCHYGRICCCSCSTTMLYYCFLLLAMVIGCSSRGCISLLLSSSLQLPFGVLPYASSQLPFGTLYASLLWWTTLCIVALPFGTLYASFATAIWYSLCIVATALWYSLCIVATAMVNYSMHCCNRLWCTTHASLQLLWWLLMHRCNCHCI